MLGLVSIVLPTYTRAHMLRHAIRSVLAQTYENLELIVVDDQSTDQTPEVVRSFTDPRVRYLRNEQNLKLPRGLNKGFALARGEYLTWTSDDNLYSPEAIEKMIAVVARGEADFVFADYYDFGRHDEATGEPLNPRRVRLPDVLRLDERNSVGACFLYSRKVYETVGLYDPELFLVEDYDYFMRIQKAAFRIRHIPEALYYFSRHDDSLYCSRFAEVQAAGILVRYKNGLLDTERAAQACVRLLMRDPEGLNSRVLRRSYSYINRTSSRLARFYSRILGAYLGGKVEAPLRSVLDQFSAQAMSFAEAKNALKELLQAHATLEYKQG